MFQINLTALATKRLFDMAAFVARVGPGLCAITDAAVVKSAFPVLRNRLLFNTSVRIGGGFSRLELGGFSCVQHRRNLGSAVRSFRHLKFSPSFATIAFCLRLFNYLSTYSQPESKFSNACMRFHLFVHSFIQAHAVAVSDSAAVVEADTVEEKQDTIPAFYDQNGAVLGADEFTDDDEPSSFASLFTDDSEEEEEGEVDESLLISNCGLSQITVDALAARGIKSMFPIQKLVFEPAMAGSDLIVRAKTGSGKTLAFALPVVEKIMARQGEIASKSTRGRAPQCLVLAPTRELAKQVEREFSSVCPSLFVGCYYGGSPIGPQLRELQRGIDIAVGTPGRIIDLIDQNALDLSQVSFSFCYYEFVCTCVLVEGVLANRLYYQS